MAPKATLVLPTPSVQPLPTPAPATHETFVPVTLFVFLGLCLAYTLSYVLYRIVMARRRDSEEAIPDSPDRGVSQFMNGTRLTLNLSQNHKPTSLSPSEPPDIPDEEKPLTDPSHPAHPEVLASGFADSSSPPFLILTSPFPDHDLGEGRFQEQGPTEVQASDLAPAQTSAPAQQPFSQRVVAKVKCLSRDRAEAIALDPKLAPVQVPLRPLSMVPSPSRKKRLTLFGLGSRHARGQGRDSATDSEAQ